jgi:hypothetical protein
MKKDLVARKRELGTACVPEHMKGQDHLGALGQDG